LKQKKRPVLHTTYFIFRTSTQVKAEVGSYVAGAAVYIPLSAAAVVVVMSVVVVLVVDTHHCSVDTDELFHAYFLDLSS
jgi:membrane protein YdbS with pleckstrin-like domain